MIYNRLEADGAHAVDVLSQEFGVTGRGKNFSSYESYVQTRALEVEELEATEVGAVAPTLEATQEKILKRISTIKSRLTSDGIAVQVRLSFCEVFD